MVPTRCAIGGSVTDVWPDVLEDRLRDMVGKGMSAGEISKALRVTRNAVIGKCDRLGLKLAGSCVRALERRRPRRVGDARHTAPDQPAFVPPSPPRRFSWQ